MITRVLLITVLAVTFANAQATRPAPDVLWQQRHAMRGMHGRMVLLDDGKAGFRVVGSSGFFNPDKSFTEQWWILRTDPQGRKRDLKEYVERGNQADVHAAFALPEGRTLAIGGMLEWIVQVDADGTVQPATRLRAGDFDIGVGAGVADKPDSLLVAGMRTVSYAESPSLIDAWLARVKQDGSLVWQKTFDRAHQDMAAAILPLKDGGCVLAINSGKYNKFGAGPTALWLLRCDADGNKVAQTVIDGAQIYAGGQKYLVPLDDAGAFVVSYTVGQLSGAMPFEAHLQAFDANLKARWSRQMRSSSSLHSMLIVRRGVDGDIVAVASANGSSPAVAVVNPSDGQVRSETTLPLPGNFNAKDMLDQPDGVVVVATYQERDRPRERDLHQDRIVLKVR